jgi:hypothetical protein
MSSARGYSFAVVLGGRCCPTPTSTGLAGEPPRFEVRQNVKPAARRDSERFSNASAQTGFPCYIHWVISLSAWADARPRRVVAILASPRRCYNAPMLRCSDAPMLRCSGSRHPEAHPIIPCPAAPVGPPVAADRPRGEARAPPAPAAPLVGTARPLETRAGLTLPRVPALAASPECRTARMPMAN